MNEERTVMWLKQVINDNIKMKSLNSDRQQLPQYQQSEQTDLILTRWAQKINHGIWYRS
jgi:hypothetical protein